jgi:hypothetical protein
MSIDWPETLVSAIARRRAVVLIGSGVSANATTDAGDHPPTWGTFLDIAYRGLGRRMSHIQKALKTYNYLEACEYLKYEYNAGWFDIIRKHFVIPQYRPADIHKAVFDLDCRIVASLNFIEFMKHMRWLRVKILSLLKITMTTTCDKRLQEWIGI